MLVSSWFAVLFHPRARLPHFDCEDNRTESNRDSSVRQHKTKQRFNITCLANKNFAKELFQVFLNTILECAMIFGRAVVLEKFEQYRD